MLTDPIIDTGVEITDAEMRSIQEVILKKYAVDFHNYEPKSFKRRIKRIYHKFNFQSSLDLWSRVLRDKEFIHDFINEVSVGLTAMFRDPDFWKYFRDMVQTHLGQQNEINIWHAGCSSGEEIYTAGIIWEELKLTNKIKSLATDISSRALNTARSGQIIEAKIPEYERNFLKFNPKGDFYSYFEKGDNHLSLKKNYFSYVSFKNSNLIMDELPTEACYDVVFCRNVLIYFDPEAKTNVIDKLYRSLKPGGFLVVGFLDSLITYLDPEKFEYFNMDQRIFRKK